MSDEQQQQQSQQQQPAPTTQPLVETLARYVAAESAAIDGEWEHLTESHQVLSGAVEHLRDRSQRVVDGIDESSRCIDSFLTELNSKTDAIENTLAVLESVAAGLEGYSLTLLQAFPNRE